MLRKIAWATAVMLAAMLPAHAQTVTMPEAKPAKPEHAVIRPQAVFPPAEYDHPFDGPVTVTVVKDIETVNKICNNPQAYLGCAISMNNGKVCSIIMVADDVIRARGWTPEIVKRHEIGHCNGWPALHPNARTAQEVAKDEADKRAFTYVPESTKAKTEYPDPPKVKR